MERSPSNGTYTYGKGKVYVLRSDPKGFAMNKGGDNKLMSTVREAYGKLKEKNSLLLRRGPYVIAACLDEAPSDILPENKSGKSLFIEGDFIDLFDPSLPNIKGKIVAPGQQTLLLDLRKVKNRKRPQILAAASRQYDEAASKHSYSFIAKSPTNTSNIMAILLPKEPSDISVSAKAYESQWDNKKRILNLRFENSPEGVKVKIRW